MSSAPIPFVTEAEPAGVDGNVMAWNEATVVKPLNVMVIVDWISLGGATALAFGLVDGLRRRGLVVTPVVVQLKAGECPPDRSWQCLNFGGDYRNPLALARAVRGLQQIIARHRPDVVETLLWNADVIGGIASARRRVPHISYVVDRREWLASSRIRHRLRRAVTKLVFKRARTRFLAISTAAAEYAVRHLNLDQSSVTVVRNGVDVRKFRRVGPRVPSSGRLTVGAISRLVEEKGVEHLVAAIALLKAGGVDVALKVAGDGPRRQALEDRAQALGAGAAVTFLGTVASASAFLETLDALAVPSIHSEGLPTTIIEAMAMGTPVVASDVGGAAEVIRHGVNGWLVPPGDSRALAEVLGRVAVDVAGLPRIAEEARMTVEREFTFERLLDQQVEAICIAVKGAHGVPASDGLHAEKCR